MNTEDLLYRPLYSLTTNEIQHLRAIADDVFEPLLRPFRQKRSVEVFDYKKSMQTAKRLGAFMPEYSRQEREHRKSTLVIAMSLSGMDRCSAVSLIPLFSELRKSLDFKLFIYTDDIIEAEFTDDGFLANDYKLAWNNVAAPVVFTNLSKFNFDKQEDTLLIIDSLGGGDSKWYWDWNATLRNEVREEHSKYAKTAEERGGYWAKIREILNGDYDRINTMNKSALPAAWHKIVERNCNERWVKAPALKDYLIRWVFNPDFANVRHATTMPSESNYVDRPFVKLKNQFKNIHLLNPSFSEDSENIWGALLRLNTVDYHHRTDSIDGLAHVLANIVHKRCTDKLTYEKLVFKEYISSEEGEEIEDPNGEEEQIHDEFNKDKTDCFNHLPDAAHKMPEKTTLELKIKKRDSSGLELKEVPYNTVDLSAWMPEHENDTFSNIFKNTLNPVVNPNSSKYSQLLHAENYINFIRTHWIKPRYDSIILLDREGNGQAVPEVKADFVASHTRALKSGIESFMELLSPDYTPFIEHMPLNHAVWCSVGKYNSSKGAIGINPDDKDKWQKTIFHELGHWLENGCPEVGAFSNHLIRQKVGLLDKKKLIKVGQGETAMPVTNGSTPWIMPYAGKWYEREHDNLPNPTEIISVYSEYFSSPEKLLVLMKHDPFMVRFIAFVLMGGPVAVFKATQEMAETKALEQMYQKSRKSSGYSSRSTRRSGRRSSSGGSSYVPKRRDKKFGL